MLLADILKLKQKIREDSDKRNFEKSLHSYIKSAWTIIEPGITFIDNWHIECICEYLEAVSLGQINRLLINMPPRYMKSISVTVGFPTWIWTKHPEKRFISLSYSSTLSKKHNMNRRDIIKSPWYQGIWSDKFALKTDMDTQMKFENDKMGFMFATSIGGTLTGEGGDVIIVDDPHSPVQAQSDAERENAIEFFRTTLPTRLNDKKKGAIVVVMQRLHEQDISGHCLADGTYTHLCLPGIAEKRSIITFPVSFKQIVREEGDILWELRENKQEIEVMKKTLGSYGFSGQYQQNPVPVGGGEVKIWWLKYWQPAGMKLDPVEVKKTVKKIENGIETEVLKTVYIEPVDLPEKFDMKLQSWDLNFKEKSDCDPVGCHVWGNSGANIYLLDRLNKQIGFSETLKEVELMTKKHPDAGMKLIEDKANGPAVIDVLRYKIGGIIPVKPEGSKEARLHAVTPWMESGNIYLPHPEIYPWVNEVIDQLIKFPKTVHDEDVDCCSQALYRFIYSSDITVSEESEYDKAFKEIFESDDYLDTGNNYWD